MDATLIPRIAERLLARKHWLATAESCTGGMIAQWLTSIAGSSEWFERGLITYSNRAKVELLGVPQDVLDRHGAVSRECAEAMAVGLLKHAPVQWAISVTGIAGPGGGAADKPVGTVWIGVAHAGAVEARLFQLKGDREGIRRQSAEAGLAMLDVALKGEPR
jgi:nicotinamide-nucleotide amidase